MPVDRCMIPPAQTFLPFRVMLHRVVERRGRIRAQHAEEIEDHTPPCPVVIALETPDEEDDAEHHSHQNPAAVRRSIPYLFPFRISDHFLMVTVYRLQRYTFSTNNTLLSRFFCTFLLAYKIFMMSRRLVTTKVGAVVFSCSG